MASILIIDDDPTIRAMFARALKPYGDVETAGNGADALRALGSKKYGVVLVDLHMPVIDGFVLLQTLATKPGPNKDTPVFVITADTSEQARVKALRRHAVFLLTKPVPIASLTSLVESALKKAAARAPAPSVPELVNLNVELPAVPGAADRLGSASAGVEESAPSSNAGAADRLGSATASPARPITPGLQGDQARRTPLGGSKKPIP
jgi:CheY-like chemotaxis protein